MGWVYGIHSLNPVVVREIAALSADEIGQRLRAAGLSMADVGGEEGDPVHLNTAFTLLATTREWELDKSLEDIEGLIDLVPNLAPVRALLKEMEDFRASRVERRFHPDEIGLMGIAIPATIAGALVAARDHTAGQSDARVRGDADLRHSPLCFAGLRNALLTDDYVWDNWSRVVEADGVGGPAREWLGPGDVVSRASEWAPGLVALGTPERPRTYGKSPYGWVGTGNRMTSAFPQYRLSW
jgi:hypothetical protein